MMKRIRPNMQANIAVWIKRASLPAAALADVVRLVGRSAWRPPWEHPPSKCPQWPSPWLYERFEHPVMPCVSRRLFEQSE